MSAVCLVNGIEGAGLDPRDRGLHYGDGVFRTLRVAHGQPIWWDEHLDRLGADAARLGLAAPVADAWKSDLDQLTERVQGGVLKLLLTRGGGQRGYRFPDSVRPCRILIYDPAPPLSDAWPAVGLNLHLCHLRLSAQPRLAGVKHLNRLENILARAEWSDTGIQEGVLRDEAGRIISGVMSNLLIWLSGRILTPRLDRCGVAGVTRTQVMRRAVAAGFAVEECDLGLDDLYAADEAMLCNSVFGLRRVYRLGERIWPIPVISPELQTLLDD